MEAKHVPWTALVIYADRAIGYVGCAGSSPTYKLAVEDAKDWLQRHSDNDHVLLYRNPACEIEVDHINILTGINYHAEAYKKRTSIGAKEKATRRPA